MPADTKLCHIDSDNIKAEKINRNELLILGSPFYTYNSYGRESAGYVCGFEVSSAGKFDLRDKPNAPQHEGVGRYCFRNGPELNYDPKFVQSLVQMLQTDGERPLANAESLRNYCMNHQEFHIAKNTYVFKITDDNPDKGGYPDKDSDQYKYEGGVTFFSVKLSPDTSNVILRADTFVADLLYPYIDAAEHGIVLYGPGGSEQCHLKNGAEIQIADTDGTVKEYNCQLYDTRTLYDIDRGVHSDKLVLMDKELRSLSRTSDDFCLSGIPVSCRDMLIDIDKKDSQISIHEIGIFDKNDKIKAGPDYETVQVDEQSAAVRTSKKNGRNFLSVQVPNDDPKDRRYQRTFLVFPTDKAGRRLYKRSADGVHVSIKLDPDKDVKLTRSIKTTDGWQQEESQCTVGELKEKLSKKPELRKKVERNVQTAQQTSHRKSAAEREPVRYEY